MRPLQQRRELGADLRRERCVMQQSLHARPFRKSKMLSGGVALVVSIDRTTPAHNRAVDTKIVVVAVGKSDRVAILHPSTVLCDSRRGSAGSCFRRRPISNGRTRIAVVWSLRDRIMAVCCPKD